MPSYIPLLSLSPWGLICGVIGLAVGASHLIVMGRESRNNTEAA